MDRRPQPMPERMGDIQALRGRRLSAQENLFPVRLITRESPPVGEHIRMVGRADDGAYYYCKDDRQGIPCRMREAIFSQLAAEVNLATPEFRVVEDEMTGESFFGSRRHHSTVNDMKRKRFLRTESKDELGRYRDFPGRWLSQLYVFDLFAFNWDRSANNLIVYEDGSALRLTPVDFSAAELGRRTVDQFPVESCETVQVARQLRQVHGFFADSAQQMIALLEAVPLAVFESFFNGLPLDWIDAGERESLCGLWAGDGIRLRLDALRTGIGDGRLL